MVMMMSERFMVDDAGTLIDMETRNSYDYVSDVVDLLNNLHEENGQLKKENKELEEFRYAVFKNLHKITEKGDVE